jgi:hypothetical protein
MLIERLSNLSLGFAVLLSFIVVTICVSFFATMNSSYSCMTADRDSPIRKANHGNPLLNGS